MIQALGRARQKPKSSNLLSPFQLNPFYDSVMMTNLKTYEISICFLGFPNVNSLELKSPALHRSLDSWELLSDLIKAEIFASSYDLVSWSLQGSSKYRESLLP